MNLMNRRWVHGSRSEFPRYTDLAPIVLGSGFIGLIGFIGFRG